MPELTTSQTSLVRRSLNEIIENFPDDSQRFLLLKISGLTDKQSLAYMSLKQANLDGWRALPDWKAAEDHLIANADMYEISATKEWTRRVRGMVQALIEKLIEKGKDWDNLEASDKRTVMQLISLVSGRTNPKKSEPTNYDQYIKKLRMKK